MEKKFLLTTPHEERTTQIGDSEIVFARSRLRSVLEVFPARKNALGHGRLFDDHERGPWSFGETPGLSRQIIDQRGYYR